MNKFMNIEEEIIKLKNRNKRVEADKAWETSLTRKIAVAIITYVVIVLFFFYAQLPKPFINAIVPTLGFILSTLSVSLLKKIWIKYFLAK